MAVKEKKVGIIILNYNGYKDTIECLESLKAADFSGNQVFIFVIDNGSSNESVYEISQWMKNNLIYYSIMNDENMIPDSISNILYTSSDNLGFSGGNNIGIRLAKKAGMDYVLLLNNDTTVTKKFLNPLLTTVEKDASIGIVGAKIVDYYHKKNYILGGYLDLKRGSGYHFYNTEQAHDKNITFTSGCIWLIPIYIFDKCGLMDPNYFLYVEDVDFCYKVIACGYDITCTKDSVIYHKEGRSTVVKPTTAYYNTRNRLYLMGKVRISIWAKIFFYFYFGITRGVKILTTPSLASYIKQGFIDYRRNFYGKYKAK